MLRLYHGSGSTEVQLVREHNSAIWGLLKRNVVRYLELHGDKDAEPWQRLYFFPLPQGHGALRPICWVIRAERPQCKDKELSFLFLSEHRRGPRRRGHPFKPF
jgi:hypothetical protein